MVTLKDAVIVIPIFTDPNLHPLHKDNFLSALYVREPSGAVEMRTFNHLDGLTRGSFDDLMDRTLLTPHKKHLLSVYPFPNVYDMDLLNYYQRNKPMSLEDIRINAIDVLTNRHYKTNNINTMIPLYKHQEYCDVVADRIDELRSNADEADWESYQLYNNNAVLALYSIERNGLLVDQSVVDLFDHRVEKHISDSLLYSDYFLCTSAGRPSNSFGSINFAALEPHKRSFIRPRNDHLMEFDYDAYHVRILGDLMGYDLPTTSVHEHLSQYYGDVTYGESKAITFRYLYGTIPPQVSELNPFFRGVKDLSDLLWQEFTQKGFIETPVYKRRMLRKNLPDMSQNKLLNYYIQATETERNIRSIIELQRYLYKKKTKLVLYNYDSFLFDVRDDEQVLDGVREILEQKKFITKCKTGPNYGEMS
jgi:hypothetical protein